MKKLALYGGTKVRSTFFPGFSSIGQEEKEAVMRVLETGTLSRYLGCWHENFYGGDEVRALEREWAEKFNVKHAIAVNSATSGLFCAIGATGIEPGDEVIVSPYTMSASAVGPLVYNAIPVFADIEEDFFCLSAESIEANISPRTKAIIIVDLFGQAYDADKINAIAKKHGLLVIEDCAQAPGAKYKGRWAGTLGDIGIYSLNYHKHIHTGEGGIIVTNNDELAEKMRLIRNHAEAVIDDRQFNTSNMIGFNYRLTEIQAAIARKQLKKLDVLVKERVQRVEYLASELAKIPCLEVAKTRPDCSHVYYVHALKFKDDVAGCTRNAFVKAVGAELAFIQGRETEGVAIEPGYVKPLYLQQIYQKKNVYGTSNYPWSVGSRTISYEKGICPVAERMHEQELFLHEFISPTLSLKDLDDVIRAFYKVWENREELV